MIDKYAELQDRALLYNACKGILRVKQSDFNPYELYYNKKIELLSQLAKSAPQYAHTNATAQAEKILTKKIIRDMLMGGGLTAAGAGLTVLGGGSYLGTPITTLIPKALGAGIKGGIAGLAGGGIYGVANRRKYMAEGWDAGDKADKDAYNKAMREHETAVKNALDAFNMKYTGSTNPDSAAIRNGGINIFNESNGE